MWVPAAQHIVEQGDEGEHFYVIIRGSCEVMRRESERSKPVKVAEVSTGGFFGERALLSRERRAATVVAKGSVKLGKIDAATFVRLAPRLRMQNSLSLRIARTRQLVLCQSVFRGWVLRLQQQQYHRKVGAGARERFVVATMEAWRRWVQAELAGRTEEFLAAVPVMAGLNDGELKRVAEALEVGMA